VVILSLFKDALSYHVVAEFVNGNDKIIVISYKEVEVHSEVEVAHSHHVLKVLNVSFVTDLGCIQFLEVSLFQLLLISHNWLCLYNWYFLFFFLADDRSNILDKGFPY